MDLGAALRARYGLDPQVTVRAPGRVNVIGEHTDYSLLPVMPMAIQRGLTIAAAASGDRRIAARSDAFDDEAEFDLGAAHSVAGGWPAYLAAAAAEAQVENGARLIIAGDLPPESGLSSSAALMVGVITALRICNGATVDREDIARRAISAEQRIGVRSGGMDQTVVAFAASGSLLRIDFEPPARQLIAVPPGVSFVVASSGERAAKGGAARDRYNELVLGARLAALLIGRLVGLPGVTALGSLGPLHELAAVVENLPESASLARLADSGDELDMLLPPGLDRDKPVAVRAPARHAIAEAARVDEAEVALSEHSLESLGSLLRRSHAGLRDDLGCSTPALDRLCTAMQAAGAAGARLTGAGFGGYAVGVTSTERAADVVRAAIGATGGPAFTAQPSDGLRWW
jgi:galactokinase